MNEIQNAKQIYKKQMMNKKNPFAIGNKIGLCTLSARIEQSAISMDSRKPTLNMDFTMNIWQIFFMFVAS